MTDDDRTRKEEQQQVMLLTMYSMIRVDCVSQTTLHRCVVCEVSVLPLHDLIERFLIQSRKLQQFKLLRLNTKPVYKLNTTI